ncbi:MAG: alpha-glucosidase [Oscillospiraceae bacterium]|nr:alpha-glucosidase [Oscillospiraceae bacterium]
MLHTQLTDDRWTLFLGEEPLIRHSEALPFVTMIRLEKRYSANRGTVKTEVEETARVPLTQVVEEPGAQDASVHAVRFRNGGHSLRMEYTPCPGGVSCSFQGEPGWTFQFRLPAYENEAVFGGGEQYRKVNLRGERVVNFVSEHIKASTILQKAVLPKSLYREKTHSHIGSYSPMPVFVTDRGRLFLFQTDHDGASQFGSKSYTFRFDGCPERMVLLLGRRYEDLSRLLALQIPNRQYLPDWCLDGMILGIQGGTRRVLEKTFAMLDAGAKICGVWCQDWSGENRTVMGKQVWWNWEVDEKLYPDLKQAIARLRVRGVRFLAYINPYLVKDGRLYNECRDKGWLITRTDGTVYHIKSTTFDAGMLDLTNPEAVRYLKETLIKKNMLDLGISGWMADFGEYLPVDCVLHDGDPAQLHNRWPVLWAKINREAIEEYGGGRDLMFFTRSGYLGIQSYAPVMWNGDQHTDFSRDYGMPCVMPASFSLGFSGAPMIHSDIGGFFSFAKLKRSEELFIRWMEMNTFSLLMRSHESIRPWANAQFDAEGVKPYTVALTGIHRALKPYIAHCAALAGEGVPVMRPDFWEAVSFSQRKDPYAYYLGEELFVCPVVEEGRRYRQVFLPAGDWVHFWTGRELTGGKAYRVGCSLGRIPVFYRKGSVYAPVFKEAAKLAVKPTVKNK